MWNFMQRGKSVYGAIRSRVADTSPRIPRGRLLFDSNLRVRTFLLRGQVIVDR